MTGTDIEVYEPLETSLIRPAADLAQIEEAFRDYQAICERLLDASDYQTYEKWNPDTRRKEPAQYKKRSAWRKLATAMGVRFEIVSMDKRRNDDGRTLGADVVARAIHPNGRYADGWGNCDHRERCNKCAEGCDGFRHFSKPEHDIPATAETRAKNRAAADLFGLGEVSAEEMQGVGREETQIEEAEIIRDPAGEVFPDQRDFDAGPPSSFSAPTAPRGAGSGDRTQAQEKMLFRLRKKLVDELGQPEEAIRNEIDKAVSKSQASELITKLKRLAGETD